MGSTQTFGKVILLGEHAAVRGQPAVVFPLRSRSLQLQWQQTEGSGFEVDAGDFAPAFRAALEEGLKLLSGTLPEGRWVFRLSSDVPPRAGLGSSAALSVALTRFFQAAGLLGQEPFAFALELENLFHGKSSGMDVAAVLEQKPILFRRGSPAEALSLGFQPQLFLTDTNLRSSTKACVEKVIRQHRPDLDEAMGKAALKGASALARKDGLALLAEAFDEALACFRAWDLVPARAEAQMAELKAQGALAVKPTGSGDGGYLLSLWAGKAPGLIPV